MIKSMSHKLPWLLVIVLLGWSLTTTFFLIQRQSDHFIAPPSTEPQQSERLQTLEKISFIRQFVDQYLTYTSSNFWQTQTALAFLMSKELREERLLEITRLKSRLEQREFGQKSQIQLVTEIGKDLYAIHVRLLISRDGKSERLNSQVKLQLTPIPRSVENPWGLQITALQFQEMTAQEIELPSSLAISDQRPLILSFPCSVENFSVGKDLPLQVKIVTMNVSEVQLLLTQKIAGVMDVKAICADSIFPIQLKVAESTNSLFADMRDRPQQKKNLGKDSHIKRKKGPYEKTIEDQMGFIIEE